MTNFTKVEKSRATSFVNQLLPCEPAETTVEDADIPDFIKEMNDEAGATTVVKNCELKRYLSDDVIYSESVENYWRRRKLDFPCLFEVAAKVFSIVPSESACETTFSLAGHLLDKRRNRLQHETVEKIVVGCQLATKYPEWVEDLQE
ncbi:hypothetical protein CAEBREN_23180 [Caenorhabditis brenneri]|uniref:HAT C-terminal dimerisation domain-containing protein n=1 Tax=Caenorhabditis brenneri TaxID=135651 RepID=G0MW39_CAEBE|nr:hypothetical protein CAEBREN_23180 [Caenorhabditis brenneri]